MDLTKIWMLMSLMALFVLINAQDERSMIKDLFRNYDKQRSPHGDNATTVKLGVYVNSLHSISEETMDYTVEIYLRMSWYDPRLKFSPRNNKKMIKLPDGFLERIWVPDIYFRNEKRARYHSVTVPNRLLRLYSDGKIWYALRLQLILSCRMMLHKFPMDTQRCPMMMESFGHTMDTIIFKFMDDRPPIAFDEMAEEMPQFTRTGHEMVDCSMNYTTGAYPCLMFRLTLKRDIGYYVMQVYLPCIVIVLLSCVTYWIDIEAIPARVTLILITVLTMTTLTAGSWNTLPKVSYVKAIDVWMFMCLIFVFSSVLEFAVVNVFSRKEIQADSEAVQMTDMNAEDGKQTKGKKMIPDPDGKSKARQIDKLSGFVFPAAFLLFNIIYWALYC